MGDSLALRSEVVETSYMTPISFPKDPTFADPSEREVWKELMAQLPPDAAIICNLVILEPHTRYEIDFIVAIPDLGIGVIEVKGGEISPNQDSTFKQKDSRGSRTVDPITQVTSNLYELKRYLDRRSSIQHFAARPFIVFPYSHIETSYSRPDIPRSIVIDKVDLASIVSRVENNLEGQPFRPSTTEIHSMVLALGQVIDSQKSIIQMGLEREDEIAVLTKQQFRILDLCKVMSRFSVLGAAGCGKTFVAMEQARRRTKAGEKVLFLCYNMGLSEYLKRKFETLPDGEIPEHVATLHSLRKYWGIDISTYEYDDNYFDRELPSRLAQALKEIPVDSKFDVVIIDEAQDFHEEWWQVVLGSLKDPDKGKIYAFGDIRQGIFRHAKDIPLELAPIHLDQNLRNSIPISELASLCVEDPLELVGLDGPPVKFVETTREQAILEADRVVKDLLSEGWSAGDICVIATGSRHPVHKDLVESAKRTEYWNSFFDDDQVFYGHINGFKGLERRVVVLAINGFKNENAKKDMLYTAITRARDVLYICAKAEDLREAGGKEMLKRITIDAQKYPVGKRKH